MENNDATQLPDYNSKTKADWTEVTKPVVMDRKANNSTGDFHDHRVKFYDDNTDAYEADMFSQQYSGPRYVAITAHKYLNGNEEAEILDIGAGTGLVVPELRKLGKYENISGLDPAGEMLKKGKEKGLYKEIFIKYFNIDSGLPSDAYDAIVCCGALMPGHMKANSVAEMSRLLRKGGFMCLGQRELYLETDADLKTLRPLLQKLVDEGVYEKWEDSVVPNWFSNLPGSIMVYKKL